MFSSSSTQSAIGAFPTVTAQFVGSLPRELREEIDSLSSTPISTSGPMSAETFQSTYAPSSGPLRLGQWQCTDADRPASRLGPQARNYQATIAFGDRITTSTASASGPVGALTAMLHDRGISVELLTFHQRPAGDGTATFIRGSDGIHAEWAMGLSEDATQSALRAVIACANRLHAGRG
jgi:hypothetical protein